MCDAATATELQYAVPTTSAELINFCLMEKLNSDCLLEVFKYLGFLEKVKLETVCRRWFNVLQQCTAYSKTNNLDISQFLIVTNSEYYQQDNLNFEPLVNGIVRRGGPYVKEITFGCRWLRISQAMIEQIAKHCTQLQHLDLGCTIINGSIAPLLEKVASQLESFSIEESSWVNDDHSNQLPTYMNRFKTLTTANLRKAMFSLNCIVSLPNTLEFIDISATKCVSSSALVEFFNQHPKLRVVKMNPVTHSFKKAYSHWLEHEEEMEDASLADTIVALAKLPNLETLELGYIPHDAYLLNMNVLAQITTLTSLHFETCDCLTHVALQTILAQTQLLETLTVINCAKVADYSSIANLRNLKHLHVEKTVQICDIDLEGISDNRQLKTLKLRKCFNITNKGVRFIMSKCALAELDLSMCENINDNVLAELFETDNCCRLRTLSLNTCPQITGKGIERLLSNKGKLSYLQQLDVTRNKHVVNDSILSLHCGLQSIAAYRKEPLECYVSYSGVSPSMETIVKDTITLIF